MPKALAAVFVFFFEVLFAMEGRNLIILNNNPFCNDFVVSVVSVPDVEKINEIKEIQIQRNQLYDRSQKLKDCPQKSFFEIQKALFPCYALLLTCKQYYEKTDKLRIKSLAAQRLYQIFPQGVALFFLSRKMQLGIALKYQSNFKKLMRAAYAQNLCDNEIIKEYLKDDEINAIVYIRKKGGIKAFMLLEHIVTCINKLCVHGTTFVVKNLFAIINAICSSDAADLTLPTVNGNCNLAQLIYDNFHYEQCETPYFSTFFSEQARHKIEISRSKESGFQREPLLSKNDDSGILYSPIIEQLVESYFFPSEEIKK